MTCTFSYANFIHIKVLVVMESYMKNNILLFDGQAGDYIINSVVFSQNKLITFVAKYPKTCG